MTFYLKEEFLSFDHFDIWDEQDQLVCSANREFFTFGKKLNVEDASGRQIAAIQHVPFSIPCTYVLTIEGQDYDLTRNFAFFSRSYSLDALGWEIEGDFMSLEYAITKNGATVASIQREFLTLGSRTPSRSQTRRTPCSPSASSSPSTAATRNTAAETRQIKTGTAMGQSLFLRRPQPGKEEASIFRQSSQ